MCKTSQFVCSDYYPEDTGDVSLRNVDTNPPGHTVSLLKRQDKLCITVVIIIIITTITTTTTTTTTTIIIIIIISVVFWLFSVSITPCF